MSRPKLLDLFCGAGGCAKGYQQAGYYVVGVDINPQPRYCGDEFFQADAMTFPLNGFDAYHGSPPCQDYSKHMRHLSGDYPRLIEPTRERFKATGRPWVIENVEGAPLPVQTDLFGAFGVALCGSMFGLGAFGLQIRRHRLFETSFPVAAPRGCDHSRPALNPHNAKAREAIFAANGRDDPERPWRDAMGIEWMHMYEGREAVPPAYTEYIGARLLDHLEATVPP